MSFGFPDSNNIEQPSNAFAQTHHEEAMYTQQDQQQQHTFAQPPAPRRQLPTWLWMVIGGLVLAIITFVVITILTKNRPTTITVDIPIGTTIVACRSDQIVTLPATTVTLPQKELKLVENSNGAYIWLTEIQGLENTVDTCFNVATYPNGIPLPEGVTLPGSETTNETVDESDFGTGDQTGDQGQGDPGNGQQSNGIDVFDLRAFAQETTPRNPILIRWRNAIASGNSFHLFMLLIFNITMLTMMRNTIIEANQEGRKNVPRLIRRVFFWIYLIPITLSLYIWLSGSVLSGFWPNTFAGKWVLISPSQGAYYATGNTIDIVLSIVITLVCLAVSGMSIKDIIMETRRVHYPGKWGPEMAWTEEQYRQHLSTKGIRIDPPNPPPVEEEYDTMTQAVFDASEARFKGWHRPLAKASYLYRISGVEVRFDATATIVALLILFVSFITFGGIGGLFFDKLFTLNELNLYNVVAILAVVIIVFLSLYEMAFEYKGWSVTPHAVVSGLAMLFTALTFPLFTIPVGYLSARLMGSRISETEDIAKGEGVFGFIAILYCISLLIWGVVAVYPLTPLFGNPNQPALTSALIQAFTGS